MPFANPEPERMDEIVFEKKNKKYGAYWLRKQYVKTVRKAFIWSVCVFALIFTLPMLVSRIHEETQVDEMPEFQPMQFLEPPAFEPMQPVFEAEKTENIAPVPKKMEPIPPKKIIIQPAIKDPNKKLIDLFTKVLKDSTLVTKQDSSLPDKTLTAAEEKAAAALKIWVDALPSFPGGPEALLAFLKKNIVYPPLAKKSGIAGTVIVSFMVEPDGSHADVKIVSGVGAGCDDEVVRVVRIMPLWKPGKRHGRNIAFLYNLPVQFALK